MARKERNQSDNQQTTDAQDQAREHADNATDNRDIREMTADTIGRDILQALVQEIKLLPKPWDALTQAKQDEVIDRLRNRVEYNVKMGVHLIASDRRTTVVGELESITAKDGIKCVFKVNSNAVGRHELFDSVTKPCLLVIADAASFTGGMEAIKGESDQRAMNLGHEYHDNDGGGMEDNIIDTEVRELGYQATAEELKEYYDMGYTAAANGQPESSCPQASGPLCIQWIKGHKQCVQDRTDSTNDGVSDHDTDRNENWPFPNPNYDRDDGDTKDDENEVADAESQ